MEKWKVFYINGVEKCAYTLFGTFDGEEESTKELLAYENDVNVSEVETKIEIR